MCNQPECPGAGPGDCGCPSMRSSGRLQRTRANGPICVILSGSGSDGTLGLRAIHGVGGSPLCRSPPLQKYDGMPSSAVNSGLATYVLPVEKIPGQLVAYVKTIADTGVPPPCLLRLH